MTGTPLAALLEEAGVLEEGIEVVFYGTDSGEVTLYEQTVTQNFARSMSLAEAMHPDNLLCYAMNDEPLPAQRLSPAPDCSRLVWHCQCQMVAAH
ncbi:MAG: molybdopterin-dependent oxidoreductase [Caldilineaceae bacterium]